MALLYLLVLKVLEHCVCYYNALVFMLYLWSNIFTLCTKYDSNILHLSYCDSAWSIILKLCTVCSKSHYKYFMLSGKLPVHSQSFMLYFYFFEILAFYLKLHTQYSAVTSIAFFNITNCFIHIRFSLTTTSQPDHYIAKFHGRSQCLPGSQYLLLDIHVWTHLC